MRLLLSFTIAATWAIAASAQNLSTEITVERTVETDLPAASAMQSVTPAPLPMPEPRFNLRPVQYNTPSDFNPAAPGMNAPILTGIEPDNSHRGYLWGGYFPLYNLGIAMGYRLIDAKDTHLDASARFNGMSYKNKKTFGPTSVRSNTFGIGADLSHKLSPSTIISASASYMYAGQRRPMLSDEHSDQGINSANVSASITHSGALAWHASAAYSYFGLTKDIPLTPATSADPATDSYLRIGGGISLPLARPARHTFDLDASLQLLRATGTVWTDGLIPADPEHNTTGIFTLNPKLRFSPGRLRIKVGLTADIGIRTPGRRFRIAPDVSLAYIPSGAFAAYIALTGGENYYTLRRQYEWCEFAPASTASMMTYTPVDARIGFNFRASHNLRGGLFAGYTVSRGVPMAAVVYHDFAYRRTFVDVNMSGWTLGADITFTPHRSTDISFEGRYNPDSCNPANPDRAETTLKASVKVRPIRPLALEAAYELRAGRKYFFLSQDGSADVNMRNISDLSFGASYTLSENLNVFIHLDNIFNRHALLVAGIEQQSIHGLVGAQYRF